MPEWVRVAEPADCPAGQLLGVEANGDRVVLANVDGTFYALEDRCSHQDFPLSEGDLDGDRLECIFHGARFEVASGRAVQLPAVRPVRTFPVDLRDDGIYIDVE